MKIALYIALKHLLARRRQSFVSLLGIILGVAFFLAISSMMKGSENDMMRRLVDNSPHITIYDEYRNPNVQPVRTLHPDAVIEIHRIKPMMEIRGIRGFEQILDYLRSIEGVRASAVMNGQGIINYAGRDKNITLNGMVPEEIRNVSTIENYMVEGSVDNILANPDGIVIGAELSRKMTLKMGDNLTITTTTGQVRTFKVLGIFRTGRASYDEFQAFVDIKRVQAMLNRPNRANTIIVKMDDPSQAQSIAADIEEHIGYKAVSWQEASEDLMNTFAIRNTIMFTVVSAVLVVAAFGIYNVISTVVMEKQRDISILKSMGFHASDIRRIFTIQGVILGATGCGIGIPLGCMIMFGLMQIRFRPPGGSEFVNMPIDWGISQFLIAMGFAMFSAILAAILPARKAARVQPVDILRGGM